MNKPDFISYPDWQMLKNKYPEKKLAKFLFNQYCDSDVSFIKSCTLYAVTKNNSKIDIALNEYTKAVVKYDEHMSLSNYDNVMDKLVDLLKALKIYKIWIKLANEL